MDSALRGDAPAPAFVLSCVDKPRPDERLEAGALLSGKGWAISDSPIASIAVYLGERFLCYASYGQPRPEIGRSFAHYPQAHHSGFIFSVPLDEAAEQDRATDLEFRFRTEDGGQQSRHVPVRWPGTAAKAADADEANRPWPIRLRMEECRLDAKGRLHLRGWAVARQEIDRLDIFLNETRLDAPERNLARADIGQRHPSYPGAAQSGFRLVQLLDRPAEDDDIIRVVARAGGVQRQIIVPLAQNSAQPRLLQKGAVTLCCETLRRASDGTLAIAGWAVGAAETREIEIRAGAVSLGIAELGLKRPDIGNRFAQLPGARFPGFRFRTLAPGIEPPLSLIVRDALGGERILVLPLPGGAASEDTAADELIHAAIDQPALSEDLVARPWRGPLRIAGWAVCAAGIAEVEVFADEESLGRAFVGIRREDIGAQFPDLPEALTAGFALTVPYRKIGDGEHLIRVVIHTRSGLITERAFPVIVAPEDDGRLGAVRRLVPAGETALRLDLLARLGKLPRVSLLIRRGNATRPLDAMLEMLRVQTLPSWRGLLLVADEPARAAAAAELAAIAALGNDAAGRVVPWLASDALPAWPEEGGAQLDLIGVLRPFDRLGAEALLELALEARLSGADFVYADERCYDPARAAVHPFLKPGWSPELLLAGNYIGRAWCATEALAARAGVTPASLEQFGEYDAVLKLTEAATRIAHLPLFLAERVGRRIEPRAREQAALVAAMDRRGEVAEVLTGPTPESFRIRRATDPAALVSVIIPTCGARGLIYGAIASLRERTAHRAIEIVVLDDVPEEDAALKAWLHGAADRVLPMAKPFNWSRGNNLGARAARGTYLLFLNDDTEATDPAWLDAMLELAQLGDVGAVGPQLLYGDGKVQHAGMFLRQTEGLHAWRFAAADDPGPFGLALTAQEVTAVTGACLLTRRDVFVGLGGFDEHHGVIKNDLDYCLRCGAAGLRVLYTPHARLTHHEMASRAPLPDSFDTARFDGAWVARSLRGDGLRNPHLAADTEDYRPDAEPVEWLQPGGPLLRRGEVRRILAMKLDHIGDFISCLPALARLRGVFPNARITLLGAATTVALAKLSPAVDEVLQFDFFATKSVAGKRGIGAIELEALAAQLRPRGFDLAIDLRMHLDTRHVLRASGARLLAGFDHGHRFPWLDIVLEWPGDIALASQRSHIGRSLLNLIGAIETATAPYTILPGETGEADQAMRTQLFTRAGRPEFADRRFVCLHPAAGAPIKEWPIAAYAGLIRLLLADYPVSIVLIGSLADAAAADELALLADRPDHILSLAGIAKLGELPGLLRGCALFVGNDSGPKHLAGALGVPTIGVHAAHVDATEWGAAGPRAITLRRAMSCGPCYLAEESDCPRGVVCLRGIAVDEVYRAARLLLAFAFPSASAAGGAASGAGGTPMGPGADTAATASARLTIGGATTGGGAAG